METRRWVRLIFILLFFDDWRFICFVWVVDLEMSLKNICVVEGLFERERNPLKFEIGIWVIGFLWDWACMMGSYMCVFVLNDDLH